MFDIDFNLKGQLVLHIRKFLLYPDFWEDNNNRIDLLMNWQQIQFTTENIAHVPESHGLYCFVVKPSIPNFFETNYLFYIGETQRTLKVRYSEYLRDQKGLGKPRPKVFEMLNLYKDYIHFYYAVIEDNNLIEGIESKLLNTFVPAINTKIPNARINPELLNIYEQ
ncbi:MAG: hypothetical protein KUL78_00925 [Flavobacterium sp.]|nr:hypothetical protein [Flavobacterium sp.]